MSNTPKNDPKTGVILGVLFFMMFGFAYLCVPLYRIFCQKTGYGGTPQIVAFPSNTVKNRSITIQFVANTHRDLDWQFIPLQHETTIKIGQNALAFYKAKNMTSKPMIGMATYNVTPEKAGPYFHKVACFCFERQLLHPHQEMDMPLQFYIDPLMLEDPDMKDINLITLSYTFFEVK